MTRHVPLVHGRAHGDCAREMAWMYAPFVNSYKRYQLGSWAPTAIVWSRDNRTCGFRTVGEHTGAPRGVPHPGRRREPVPRVRGDDRGGLWGIENKVEPPRDVRGQRLRGQATSRACRTRCTRRSRRSASVKVAREAFGDFVFEHLLNTAVQEQAIFDNTCVTDWELARYFERG